MECVFSLSGLLMLPAGVILTVITICRMMRGEIRVPVWARALLILGMVLLQVILLLSILPPLEVEVSNPFVNEQTHIVMPADPVESNEPSQ